MRLKSILLLTVLALSATAVKAGDDLPPIVAGNDLVPIVAGNDLPPIVAGNDLVPIVASPASHVLPQVVALPAAPA